MKKLLTSKFIIIFYFTFTATAQNEEGIRFPFPFYGDGFIIGANIAYMPDHIPPHGYIYHHWIGSIKATYPVLRWLRTGIEVNNIYDYSRMKKGQYYTVGGITTEFIRFPYKKWQFYFLTNVFYGNYCTCGDFEPYEYPGLFYLGWGLGASFFISNSFMLQFGFDSNQILNDASQYTYGFGKYFIRANYAFPGRKQYKSF